MTFLRRSFLYVPGSNERALEKVKSLRSDAIIFDLEDAVAPDNKASARSRVAEIVRTGGFANCEVLIRINDLTTPWSTEDLRMVAAVRPDGLVVPKVSDCHTIANITQQLTDSDRTQIWAMIETPLGVLEAYSIATFARRSSINFGGFIVGTNDISRETGALPVRGRLSLLMALSQCVFSAKAFGFCAIDGVYNNFKDAKGFEAECLQARELGFDGKTLIHPDQVHPCNAAFKPSEQELTRARAIIDAFAKEINRGAGAVQLDGEMIELLHLDMAKRVIASWNATSIE